MWDKIIFESRLALSGPTGGPRAVAEWKAIDWRLESHSMSFTGNLKNSKFFKDF